MLHMMRIMRSDEDKDKIPKFPCTSSTNSTLNDKKYIPVYAEDLHFLINHAGWLVTHVYEHYTFKCYKFKKDFVMNQKSMQKATSSVEREFKTTEQQQFCNWLQE